MSVYLFICPSVSLSALTCSSSVVLSISSVSVCQSCTVPLLRFVDGESYMATVADAIVAAKDEIYITDWM